MPRTSDDRLGTAPRFKANSFLAATLRPLTCLVIGVATLALAAQLLNSRISASAAALLGAALAVSSVFGLVIGLLAAAIALMACDPAWGAHLQVARLSQDLPFTVAFGATVVGVGYFADQARRRARMARAVPPARPASPNATGRRTKHFGVLPDRLGEAVRRLWASHGARQRTAGFGVAIVGAGLAAAFHKQLGIVGTMLVAMTPAMVAAEWMDARLGMAIAGLAGGTLAWLFPGAESGALLVRAIGVCLVAALGWRIGALAEQARCERDARHALTRASHWFSDCGDERAIRAAVLDGLRRLDPGAAIEIRDENGAPCTSGPAAAGGVASSAASTWRARRLFSNGRDVGEVRWRSTGTLAKSPAAGAAAAALIDTGAAAIVRARLAAEINDMEDATRAEQLRTILLDAVSHHFRSPLAGILGSVTSILGHPAAHDRRGDRQFLLIIREQANRLNRYIDNFLSLARLEASAIEINPSEIDLENLIYEVWDSFGASGGARRYLQVDLEVVDIQSDAGLLSQVFGNVLENAVKYSPEGSVVAIRGTRHGETVSIQVVDEGCGVPEAALGRMFNRFHRVHAGDTPGMGLGLYITRSLVEMLGGQISASNRSDGQAGLVMTIELPSTAPGA